MRVFVYGTGYPAARFDDLGGEIVGVAVLLVAETAHAAVRVLDEIEDEGTLYRRVEIATSSGPAMSYEWLGAIDGLRSLPSWPPGGPGNGR